MSPNVKLQIANVIILQIIVTHKYLFNIRLTMNSQGRREKLKTVETLVSLLLINPNQTRKDVLDKMMGKGQYLDSLPESLKHNGRKLSRQSVYKALDFLKDAGILKEESDKTIFRVNRYTIKSVILNIDMEDVWNRYGEIRVSELQRSDAFNALPEIAKNMVMGQMKRGYQVMYIIDKEEKIEGLNFLDENIGKIDTSSFSLYMHLQDISIVMEYLKIFEEMRTKATS